MLWGSVKTSYFLDWVLDMVNYSRYASMKKNLRRPPQMCDIMVEGKEADMSLIIGALEEGEEFSKDQLWEEGHSSIR